MPRRIQFDESKPVKNHLNSRCLADFCEYRNAANQASRSLKTDSKRLVVAGPESSAKQILETFRNRTELTGRNCVLAGKGPRRWFSDAKCREWPHDLAGVLHVPWFPPLNVLWTSHGQSGGGVLRAIEAFPRGLGRSQYRHPSSDGWLLLQPAGSSARSRRCRFANTARPTITPANRIVPAFNHPDCPLQTIA